MQCVHLQYKYNEKYKIVYREQEHKQHKEYNNYTEVAIIKAKTRIAFKQSVSKCHIELPVQL